MKKMLTLPKIEKVNSSEKQSILNDDDIRVGVEIEVEMDRNIAYPGSNSNSNNPPDYIEYLDINFVDFYSETDIEEEYFEDMYVEVLPNDNTVVDGLDLELINTEKKYGDELDWERDAESYLGWEAAKVKSYIIEVDEIASPTNRGVVFEYWASLSDSVYINFINRFTKEESFPYVYHLSDREWVKINADEVYSERDLLNIRGKIDAAFDEYVEMMTDAANEAFDDDDEDSGEFEDFVSEAESIVGESITVFEDYGDKKDVDIWGIKPDGSLSHGFEIISPPMTLKQILPIIKGLFDKIEADSLFSTQSTTGFHVSISIDGVDLEDDLDVLKLSLLVEEGKVYKYFHGREDNYYAKSVFKRLMRTPSIDSLKGKKKSEYREISDELIEIAGIKGFGKYHGINFNKISDNYIEFRYLGGRDYTTEFDLIRSQILDFAFFLKAAVDPDIRKREYILKLNRLLTELEDDE